MEKLKKRDEINDKYKWRLEDIFENEKAWFSAYDNVSIKIGDIKKYSGKFTRSSAGFLQCIKDLYSLASNVNKIFVYAYMKRDEDSANSSAQEMAGKADILATEFSAATAFFEPELLKLSQDKLDSYIKKQPAIKEYDFVIDEILRKKQHILSQAEEKLIAKASEVMSTGEEVFLMFNNADIRFEPFFDENGNKAELTIGRYVKYLESEDRNIRRRAFKSMYSAYENHKNTLAAAYSGNVKADAFYAEVRKYSSSLIAALNADNVSSKVYNGLIRSTHSHIHLLTKYLQIRQRLLNVRKVHMYDLYVPLVKLPEKNYTFEEASEIVKKALAPLGEDYGKILDKAFNDGWIDVCENQGKRVGAYSWGCYGTHPYVLLNWQGTINDVFTLAHELGHAMHTYYSNSNQPVQYADYKIFVAEVASTVNEILLMEYMLANSKDETEKAFLLNHYLEEFRTTVFRQTMFAEFEKNVHKMCEKGEVLTCEALSSVYMKLQHQYFKKVVKIDDEIAMEWARIPHFYTSFYVYKYATGFSAATHLASGILSENKQKLVDYLNFLKSGSSKYPMDLLKDAGVDLTETTPIDNAFDVFESKLEQFEALVL